jgi:hypothetical protein
MLLEPAIVNITGPTLKPRAPTTRRREKTGIAMVDNALNQLG